jgi:hypothetical protein
VCGSRSLSGRRQAGWGTGSESFSASLKRSSSFPKRKSLSPSVQVLLTVLVADQLAAGRGQTLHRLHTSFAATTLARRLYLTSALLAVRL